jgi:Ca2+-binding EF-hand superfamily protein
MGVRANVTWFAEAENVSVAAAGGKKAEQFESVMQERAESFGHADLNKDGKLDFDEYCSMVKFRETTQYTEKQLRQKFAEMDVDNSGAVELHEFIAYSLRDAVKRSKGKAIDIFQIWDADKSGYIDLHEFGKAIVALGFVAGKSDIKKCFEMLDEDNSGQIEYKELAKMLRRLGST